MESSLTFEEQRKLVIVLENVCRVMLRNGYNAVKFSPDENGNFGKRETTVMDMISYSYMNNPEWEEIFYSREAHSCLFTNSETKKSHYVMFLDHADPKTVHKEEWKKAIRKLIDHNTQKYLYEKITVIAKTNSSVPNLVKHLESDRVDRFKVYADYEFATDALSHAFAPELIKKYPENEKNKFVKEEGFSTNLLTFVRSTDKFARLAECESNSAIVMKITGSTVDNEIVYKKVKESKTK